MSYWIEFADRPPACVNKYNERDALQEAAKHGKPVKASRLPYTADPQIGDRMEAWCYSPKECQGRSSCPKRYACSE